MEKQNKIENYAEKKYDETKERVLFEEEIDFIHVKVLERKEDGVKFVDIRKYIRGFPTKTGIRMKYPTYLQIRNILTNFFKL